MSKDGVRFADQSNFCMMLKLDASFDLDAWTIPVNDLICSWQIKLMALYLFWIKSRNEMKTIASQLKHPDFR